MIAATTAKGIVDSTRVPFLGSAATLSLSIFKCAESVRSHKEDTAQIVEQIHEVLCTIVKLDSAPEINGLLSTTLLYDIGKFTEYNYPRTLQKVFTFLKSQQGMGKIKQLFTHPDNVMKLETCKQELNHALQKFRMHIAGSTIFQMGQMQRDAKHLHDEVMALMIAQPDLTSSDRSSVAGTLSSTNNSAESFSMLPPSPKIFHGRDSELQDIIKILLQDSTRIAILGTGGIGKTSLTTAALHDSQVEGKYSRQYFVPCHSSSTCAQLVSTVADYIGVEKGSNLEQKIVHYLDHSPPSLLITMRGSERPAKVKWTRPVLAPLDPLSTSAALQTFVDVADDIHHQDNVKQLLELTGNLPLAVSLIASVASHEGCNQAISQWKSENTHMLSDGYDQRSSLDISVMLSLTSSRMTSGAQDLLSVLSMLPDGLSEHDLIQMRLPIPQILACKSTLIRTSLAFIDKDHQLKVLVPIREHVLSVYPPTNALKIKLCQYFHELLNLWNQFQYVNPTDTDIVAQILRNLGNFNSVFLHTLMMQGCDVKSILLLNRFYVCIEFTCSPLFPILAERMMEGEKSPMFGDYLVESFRSAGQAPVIDAERQIMLGNEYFKFKDSIEQAKWYFALGTYFEWEQSNMAHALECYHQARRFSDSTGCPTTIGGRVLAGIAIIMIEMGNASGALEYARKQEAYSVHLGNIFEQARSLYIQSKCNTILANYRDDQTILHGASSLWMSCGLPKGGHLDVAIMNAEAEIHMYKTEYLESRQLHISMSSTLRPTSYHAIVANLNIGFIDIAIGVDSKQVYQNLETCRCHIQSLSGFQQATTSGFLDVALAELYLRDGNHSAANATFSAYTCRSFHRDEQLPKYPEMGCNIYIIGTDIKTKLDTMKALHCLGQLLAAGRDDESALSLFIVALDGFTFMDVHRWRADCMVQIADIYEKRGEIQKSLGLWKMARPLFERSSQGCYPT
ncbi:hypothetical protein C8J57DRAFT_1214804 [Mycena rebaudengoi]|nr:hypothetical protein C8J57DRAFT_1214804 [Mycena rebaudengoi]